jgi:predicted NAD/FAD-binding protein
MPRDDAFSAPLKIAVIGAGIAGLSAAWLLNQRHVITVYEQDNRPGGHSNTVETGGPSGAVPVDTGFIVYNQRNYPNLVQLFRHLGVATKPSTMSFAVSVDGGALEYAGSNLAGLFAQPANVLRPRFWRMLHDIARFYREGPALIGSAGADTLTIGDYLAREGYSRAFIDDHLLPMAAAIWSTPAGEMLHHPALAFVRFCMAHGLMQVAGRPQWRTVEGGSRAYVKRLTAPFADRIRLGSGVRQVHRFGDRVVVEDMHGGRNFYDRIVIAAHADQALAMLADPSADERRILGAFKYARNTAILHSDSALMPRRRRVWASWNYLAERRGGNGGGGAVCVTYWMNSLQSIDRRHPLFVTLNPLREPNPARVIAGFEYEHPSYDLAAIAAQGQLARLQGQRCTWFCGSYFGAGFHEDALRSGLDAAEAAGGVRRPWAGPDAEGPATAELQTA